MASIKDLVIANGSICNNSVLAAKVAIENEKVEKRETLGALRSQVRVLMTARDGVIREIMVISLTVRPGESST